MRYTVTKIIFSTHARERIDARGIAEADVRAVATSPDVTWQDQRNGSIVCEGRTQSGKRIAVCLVDPPKNGKGIVKTAYFRQEGDK